MNKNELNIQGEWTNNKESVKVKLQVFLFVEDGINYAYVPALDITGYGLNEDEAKQSMKTALSEFFRYTINKNTFDIEMKRLGWVKRKKNYKVPEITDQLPMNTQLRDIVNHKQYTSSSLKVSVPVYA